MPYGSNIYNCNRVTSTSQLNGSDLLAIFLQQNGGDSALSLTLFAEWLSENITVEGDGKVTYYSAPSATGFTATIPSTSSSYWLILTPVAGYAAGTIKLPLVANAVDKQEILCNCTQAVTTLTIDADSANGGTATGAPTTLAANAFFTLRYNAQNYTWYRVN